MPNISLSNEPHFPVNVIYDPANALVGANADESIISRVPRIVTVSNMAAGTTISIQGKVHKDDIYQELVNLDGATAPEQFHVFDPRWNFVKLIRTGVQDIVAYAQS